MTHSNVWNNDKKTKTEPMQINSGPADFGYQERANWLQIISSGHEQWIREVREENLLWL